MNNPWKQRRVVEWLRRNPEVTDRFDGMEYHNAKKRLEDARKAFIGRMAPIEGYGLREYPTSVAVEYLDALLACLRLGSGERPPGRPGHLATPGQSRMIALCWYLATGGEIDPYRFVDDPVVRFATYTPDELKALDPIAAKQYERERREGPPPVRLAARRVSPNLKQTPVTSFEGIIKNTCAKDLHAIHDGLVDAHTPKSRRTARRT